MRVETAQWNIGGAKVRNEEDDPKNTSFYYHNGLYYILDVLSNYHPDIVTLQETHAYNDFIQARVLATALGFNFINDELSKSHLEENQKLCLTVMTAFPLVSHEFKLFSNPNLTIETIDNKRLLTHDKGISGCIVQLEDNRFLKIQNLHLFPFGIFGIDFAGEIAQKIRRDVLNAIDTTADLFLLQGDFNVDSPSLESFLPELFLNQTQEVKSSQPTTPKGRYHDHIVYRGIKHVKSEVITNVLTDHYLVLSEFDI